VEQQAALEVDHVEEVGTSCEENANSLRPDTKADPKPSDNSHSAASNASNTVAENSAMPANSSVTSEDFATNASSIEKTQLSSAVASDDATLTSSSASDEKPAADGAEDDNPELTLLVASVISCLSLLNLFTKTDN